jgi:hypothetical protein
MEYYFEVRDLVQKRWGEGGAYFVDIKIKIFHGVIVDESYLRPVSY